MVTTENQDRRLSGPWWLLMLEGIAAFAFGVLLVINTERTLTLLVGLLGIYLVWLLSTGYRLLYVHRSNE